MIDGVADPAAPAPRSSPDLPPRLAPSRPPTPPRARLPRPRAAPARRRPCATSACPMRHAAPRTRHALCNMSRSFYDMNFGASTQNSSEHFTPHKLSQSPRAPPSGPGEACSRIRAAGVALGPRLAAGRPGSSVTSASGSPRGRAGCGRRALRTAVERYSTHARNSRRNGLSDSYDSVWRGGSKPRRGFHIGETRSGVEPGARIIGLRVFACLAPAPRPEMRPWIRRDRERPWSGS